MATNPDLQSEEEDVKLPKKSYFTVSNLYDLACHAADTGLKGSEARQTKLITLHLLEQAVLLLP